MCQNIAKIQFSILNLLCQIKKRRTIFDCFFCEDYEYLTYFCFAKTGKKLSLSKVCLFGHRQYAQKLKVTHVLIN